MSEATRARLRDLIRLQYDDLLSRLSRRLGSRELAGDALQDVFIRLERAEVSAELRRPASYVMRMALNIASNIRRRDGRLLSLEEAATALDVPDETQDPEAQAEFNVDLARIKQAMQLLPERRRRLLTDAWLDETPTAELALRHGLAVRTVQHEIRQALDELRRVLADPKIDSLRRRGGPGVSEGETVVRAGRSRGGRAGDE